jgi:exopolyphosphatase / guanosine-5'-triphosphate,3'-diphosphate pyrophosphatase
MSFEKKKLAAIDLGTNSFHIVVAEITNESGLFRILSKDKEVVRLGSGSTDMKYISDQAMDRGIMALKRFRFIADSYNAPIRAIATSAVREALNKDEFLKRVHSETAMNIEIASGIEEARLIYLGVLQALPVFKKKILMIDIGGGSTEFLIGEKRRVLFSNSLKIGAVRLTERFFQSSRINRATVEDCRLYVKGMLLPIIRILKTKPYELCIGCSGTINTLANIIRAQKGEDADVQINNFSFNKEELFDVTNQIVRTQGSRDLSSIKGMDSARTDIITAGAIILEQIFKELNIEKLTVSEYTLREGILLDTVEKLHLKKESVHLRDIRHSSINHLGSIYKFEKKHAVQVTQLALSIFDQTADLHKLKSRDREYLEAAAMLHEIGFYISQSQHHRHSYYLIRNAEFMGYTENEKEIIANVARYHRKSHPKQKHEGFNLLSHDDKLCVTKLASILRIADGLDRSHASYIKSIVVRKKADKIFLDLTRNDNSDLEMEIWGAERKKQLFEEVFKTHVFFQNAANNNKN